MTDKIEPVFTGTYNFITDGGNLTDQEIRLDSLRLASNLPQIWNAHDLVEAAADIENFIRNGRASPEDKAK